LAKIASSGCQAYLHRRQKSQASLKGQAPNLPH